MILFKSNVIAKEILDEQNSTESGLRKSEGTKKQSRVRRRRNRPGA